jgi:D-alanine transaminase
MVHRKISYVNGRYVPHEHAFVHIEDRGYQFADGVYEVVAILNGKMLDEKLHFKRLQRSCDCLDILMPMPVSSMRIVINEMVRKNNVQNSYIYIQITRGVAPRNHPFPKGGIKPSLVIMFTELKSPPEKDYKNGVSIITGEDIRWKRKDIKTISLLANVLAKQEAVKAKVKEIWLIDSITKNITEGSSTNAYIIDKKGILRTHPATEHILGGVTRDTVLRLACEAGLKVAEEAFKPEDIKDAKEAFITSTTVGVLPVVKIDGNNIGNGKPGEISNKLTELYNKYMSMRGYD